MARLYLVIFGRLILHKISQNTCRDVGKEEDYITSTTVLQDHYKTLKSIKIATILMSKKFKVN